MLALAVLLTGSILAVCLAFPAVASTGVFIAVAVLGSIVALGLALGDALRNGF